MFKTTFSFASLTMIQQLDPRIIELQKNIELYRILLIGSVLVVVLLLLVVILQMFSLRRAKRSGVAGTNIPGDTSISKKHVPNGMVKPGDLPDPGLIFKYSFAGGNISEKVISIGQTAGSIKTYSTEIENDHLNIRIRTMDRGSEKDIYNLPEIITDEYMIDINNSGVAMIYYPGLESFRRMESPERIYIMEEDDPAGYPTFPLIDPKQPVRIRLGKVLDNDDKFTDGYFEFHLFNQSYQARSETGIEKIEKNFLVRLYRIYPGYDLSSPDGNGLFPMIDPFNPAGKVND